MFENLAGARIDRRSFLKGSAMFAAAIGVSIALPAFAQGPQKPAPEEEKKDDRQDEKKSEKKDDKYDKKLVDGEGRVYRICPQCGNNMYKQGRMWVCENCGYSYVE
jgi:predicted RNA-binding Zn-ribbon protein involved in translation (DUF1610 family)